MGVKRGINSILELASGFTCSVSDISSLIVPLIYEHLKLTRTTINAFPQASIQFQDQTMACIRQHAKLVQNFRSLPGQMRNPGRRTFE
jgi:hypothetical protein